MIATYIVIALLLSGCVALLVLWLRARDAAGLARTETENLRAATEAERLSREQMKDAFRAEFQLLSGRIFDEKSAALKATNRESIDGLLKPFRDNLTDFRKRVDEIYDVENRQHGALKNELNNLLELNRRITQETQNLTSALKGSSKVQGDWGEMILEGMLEASNLKKNIHYTVQENVKNSEGKDQRPDVILTLPEGKRIVIDSKVSLTAYVGLTEAQDDAARAGFLREHVASVRRHIDELHRKNYQGVVADSPDFVIMFVPNEPAFMVALQADNTLWNYAYAKKVIISSPTNLFALLKIVDDLWKRDNQSRHALEIARQGGALYDKFVGFVDSLEKVGVNLKRAHESYDEAFSQLSTGKGNLASRAERLHELGIKASRKLPSKLVEMADEGAISAADIDESETSTSRSF